MDEVTIILIGLGVTAVFMLLLVVAAHIKTDNLVNGIGMLLFAGMMFLVLGLPLAVAISALVSGESVLP